MYPYKDHLGNIRINYAWDDEANELTVLNEHHYYPFGLEHNAYNTTKREFKRGESNNHPVQIIPVENSGYQYKYNGKELQDELGLNLYDYGARNYDAALGRWMNVDPLAEKYYDESNYVYALNSPVFFIDPNGEDIDVTDITDDTEEDKWLLLNLMISLADISGQTIHYKTNSEGRSILTGEGCTEEGSDSASNYVNHLLAEGNTVTVHGTDSGSEAFPDGDIFLDAKQINGMQKGLESVGFDKNTLSVGMVFLHETLHTQFGASFFNSDKDNKEKSYGRFTDDGVAPGPTVERINIFRNEMGLPTRYKYHTSNGTMYFEKDGVQKSFKYKKTPVSQIKGYDEKIFEYNGN